MSYQPILTGPIVPRVCCLALLLSLVAGCTVGPDYKRPDFGFAASFGAANTELGTVGEGEDESLNNWWRAFEDPVLNRLVEAAQAGSLDVEITLRRIGEARALLGAERAAIFPDVEALGSVERRQNSSELGGGFAPERTESFHSVGGSLTWELDVWGRVRRLVEAANADLDASVEDARAVLVSVSAETALAYIDYRLAEERLRIARENIELQGDTVALTKDQFDAGIVSELDLSQARTLLATTESTLPSLAVLSINARNRLAVLTGNQPGSEAIDVLLDVSSQASGIPEPSENLRVGVPADLLRRRPDIRRAERQLAAETARIGVAQGDLYPRFSLAGSVGYEASDIDDLFSSSAGVFGIGPSFRFPIFNAGRIRSVVNAQDARAQAALAFYEQAILIGLEDVENSLTGFLRSIATAELLREAAGHARRTVELSGDQYRQGLVSFQSVLDSQSRLFELEDQLAQTEAAIADNAVGLYRSLGGGWSLETNGNARNTTSVVGEEE